MARVSLVGVPFDGHDRPGRQARAAEALRASGLADAFASHEVIDRGDVRLPTGSGERGPSSLINEPALVAMTAALRDQVAAAVSGGSFPVVHGGDCSALPGIGAGLDDGGVGAPGLLHVDGHEDTMPLDVSEDGEAANAEIGLLLGLTGRTIRGPLGGDLPRLTPDRLALAAGRAGRGLASPLQRGVAAGPPRPVLRRRGGRRGPGRDDRSCGPAPARVRGPLVAARRPRRARPGGLRRAGPAGRRGRARRARLAGARDGRLHRARRGACAGLSLAIYDPDQDPGGEDADRVVAFVRRIARDIGHQHRSRAAGGTRAQRRRA